MIDRQMQHYRDWSLSTRLCNNYVLPFRQALEDWIEEECKALEPVATLIAASMTGPVQQKALEDIDRIRDISNRELRETIMRLDQRLEHLIGLPRPEGSIDPLDDLLYLEEGAFRLERLARALLRMRKSYEKLLDDEATGETTEQPQ